MFIILSSFFAKLASKLSHNKYANTLGIDDCRKLN